MGYTSNVLYLATNKTTQLKSKFYQQFIEPGTEITKYWNPMELCT